LKEREKDGGESEIGTKIKKEEIRRYIEHVNDRMIGDDNIFEF
jgi:hypothetical protein